MAQPIIEALALTMLIGILLGFGNLFVLISIAWFASNWVAESIWVQR
ncbi:MAG: hypothetical protein AB7R89_13385 [Dehalococcoidia bacterium]